MALSCPKFSGCCYCCSLCRECCERCIVAKSKKHPHIEYKSPEEANKSVRTADMPQFFQSPVELPQKEGLFPLHPIFSTYKPTYVVKRQPTPGHELDECPVEDDIEMQVFDKKPSGPLTHEKMEGGTGYSIPQSLSTDPLLEEQWPQTEPALHYSLIYDIQLRALNVHLQEATNLLAKGASGSVNPFVAAFLLPSKEVIRQTEVVEKNSNPYFDTVLTFKGIALKDVHQMILVLQVFDHDRFLKDQLIGTVVASLKEADLYGSLVTARINGDMDLMEKYSHGGLLLSLKYNHLEQQLEGTVIKVTNIPRHHRWGYTDPYVKVYLMHEGVRHSKWKSNILKYSPVIPVEESFSVDIEQLNINNAYLEVLVLCHARLGRNDVMGEVCIGPHSQQESGRSHWSEMILSPNQEFSKWHAFIPVDPNQRRSRSKSPQDRVVRQRSGTV